MPKEPFASTKRRDTFQYQGAKLDKIFIICNFDFQRFDKLQTYPTIKPSFQAFHPIYMDNRLYSEAHDSLCVSWHI